MRINRVSSFIPFFSVVFVAGAAALRQCAHPMVSFESHFISVSGIVFDPSKPPSISPLVRRTRDVIL
jgi:hypothetical protein